METSITGQRMRRSQPISRNRKVWIELWDRISGREAPYQRAGSAQNIKRDRPRRRRLQVVVNNCAVRRILSHRRIRRQRGVGVCVPPHAQGWFGREKECVVCNDRFIKLSQRSNVVENPESAAVRRDSEVVVLEGQVPN